MDDDIRLFAGPDVHRCTRVYDRAADVCAIAGYMADVFVALSKMSFHTAFA